MPRRQSINIKEYVLKPHDASLNKHSHILPIHTLSLLYLVMQTRLQSERNMYDSAAQNNTAAKY